MAWWNKRLAASAGKVFALALALAVLILAVFLFLSQGLDECYDDALRQWDTACKQANADYTAFAYFVASVAWCVQFLALALWLSALRHRRLLRRLRTDYAVRLQGIKSWYAQGVVSPAQYQSLRNVIQPLHDGTDAGLVGRQTGDQLAKLAYGSILPAIWFGLFTFFAWDEWAYDGGRVAGATIPFAAAIFGILVLLVIAGLVVGIPLRSVAMQGVRDRMSWLEAEEQAILHHANRSATRSPTGRPG